MCRLRGAIINNEIHSIMNSIINNYSIRQNNILKYLIKDNWVKQKFQTQWIQYQISSQNNQSYT